MNKVITDEQIRRALNESIDEFIFEEENGEQGQTGLDALKNSPLGKGVKKIGSSFWNYIRRFMDNQTNGQWNRTYNEYAKGNGVNTGYHYMKKWLDIHFRRLQNIMYDEHYGNRTTFFTYNKNGRKLMFEHNWQNNTYTYEDRNDFLLYTLYVDAYNNIKNAELLNTYTNQKFACSGIDTNVDRNNSTLIKFENGGGSITVTKGEDNSTPEAYIAENCTSNSFVAYTRNTMGDGEMKQAIISYIDNVIQASNQKNINDLQNNPNAPINHEAILKLFTMKSFSWWYYKNVALKSGKKNAQGQPDSTNNSGANNNSQGNQYYANNTGYQNWTTTSSTQ